MFSTLVESGRLETIIQQFTLEIPAEAMVEAVINYDRCGGEGAVILKSMEAIIS